VYPWDVTAEIFKSFEIIAGIGSSSSRV